MGRAASVFNKSLRVRQKMENFFFYLCRAIVKLIVIIQYLLLIYVFVLSFCRLSALITRINSPNDMKHGKIIAISFLVAPTPIVTTRNEDPAVASAKSTLTSQTNPSSGQMKKKDSTVQCSQSTTIKSIKIIYQKKKPLVCQPYSLRDVIYIISTILDFFVVIFDFFFFTSNLINFSNKFSL